LISGLAGGLMLAVPAMAPLLGLSEWGTAIWVLYWVTLMTWWEFYAANGISRGYGGYGGFWSNHYG